MITPGKLGKGFNLSRTAILYYEVGREPADARIAPTAHAPVCDVEAAQANDLSSMSDKDRPIA
jgi:hypothetical protein